MSGGKLLQSSVSFTLPISCQICLEKVKEPVTCSNQHVFCSRCMNVWLDRNSRCPTCRVEITSQSPLKKIIGGDLQSQEEPAPDRSTSRELRRARLELVGREYEDEIFLLESKLEKYEKENNSLKKQLDSSTSKDNSVTSSSSDSLERFSDVCSRCVDVKDIDTMLSLTKKLQEATKTYAKMKEEVAEVKQLNSCLIKRNDDLKRENERIREEVETRSPMKFGRLTVATLQTRLQSAEKQVDQLKKAFEKNDTYTEQLQNELKTYKTAASAIAENRTDSSFYSSAENEQSKALSQLFTSAVDNSFSKSKSLQSTLSSTDPDLTTNQNTCLINLDETSKASSYIELQSYENLFNESSQSSIPDVKTSFSRKLRFDESSERMASSFQSNEYDFVSIEDAYNSAIDVPDFSQNSQCMTSQSTLNVVNLQTDDVQPQSRAVRTKIDAGGSRITTSQISTEEHDVFSRPSSAPSRTFLLSGSRFSALRPLDPQQDNHEFQPVKCISPMHMLKNVAKESETPRPSSPMLRLVSPDDVINPQWRHHGGLEVVGDKFVGSKPGEEVRSRDALSRVNILKRKQTSKVPSTHSSPLTSSSPFNESRRKQKLSHKRSSDLTMQSPLKSPKYEPGSFTSAFH